MESSISFKDQVMILGQLAVQAGRKSEAMSRSLTSMSTEVEALKIDVFFFNLEQRRKTLALSRGMRSLAAGDDKLTMLGSAVIGTVLGAVGAGGGLGALVGGLDGLKRGAEVSGQSGVRWAVALGSKITIVPLPQNRLPTEGAWVTLDSLREAALQARRRAYSGEKLGDVDGFFLWLRQCGRLVYLGLPLFPKPYQP
ncbi:MAG: hypothetical protein Q7T04_07615 [Dehalococcoidia bacterium]|nr:hypothetical protein [Dehalococcoidia bacterium]